MMKQAVKQGCYCGCVSQQFSPILDRSIPLPGGWTLTLTGHCQSGRLSAIMPHPQHLRLEGFLRYERAKGQHEQR